jgi:hypothetical protein
MTTFYATISVGEERPYMPQVPVLLPASSWWGLKYRLERQWFKRTGFQREFKVTAPRLPEHVTERAADCGGYVAMLRWGGEYRYSRDEYIAWLQTFTPTWAAMRDWCCEPAIAADREAVRARQDRTTFEAHETWEWSRSVSWCWVPTIQGWIVDDYRRHAADLAPLVGEMMTHYGAGSAFRVGIGTLCRRADAAMIRSVVGAVAAELPGVPLHLWGVKLAALSSGDALPEQVASVDSAAWNGLFGTGRTKYHDSGMTQREYIHKVALPSYLERFDAALSGPKQMSMLELG